MGRLPLSAIVVLAAGSGSRLRLFTRYTPKPLVPIPGGTLLERHLDRLVELHLPIFVVASYLEDQIAAVLRGRYAYHNVRLVHQDHLGTAADGLLTVEGLFHGDFLVVHADHVFEKNPFPRLVGAHRPETITLLVEPTDYQSLGYGELCAFDDATGNAYPFQLRNNLREMRLVDGAMILPQAIFHHIRTTKTALTEGADMKHVFQSIAENGSVLVRAVRSDGRYANVNDLNTYCNMLHMLEENELKEAFAPCPMDAQN